MIEGGKIMLDTVMIIDSDDSDLLITEQLLRIGADTKYIYKEREPLKALDFIINTTEDALLPDFIFLTVNTRTPAAFTFLEHWESLPERIRDKSTIVLMSAFFRFQTELDQKVNKFGFVKSLLTKPLDIKQLHSLSSV